MLVKTFLSHLQDLLNKPKGHKIFISANSTVFCLNVLKSQCEPFSALMMIRLLNLGNMTNTLNEQYI